MDSSTVPAKPFLCLNMIVKNESKIIKRLLDSVAPIIDSFCICDTGSTDNTIELIRAYGREKNIPGEVFELPFRDFGFNRTKSLERAERWGQYALLLDADMILEISPQFKKQDIVLDHYQVKQKNSVIDYYNTRIVRTDKGVKCVGVTHEYYDLPAGISSGQLNTIIIDDIGDGGAKSDKFERDVRLLRRGLIEEPKNVRYHFYLANSYRDLSTMTEDKDKSKKYAKRAIKWYKKRVELGGWDEELFHSCFEIGNIYMKWGHSDRSIYWWMEAYMHRQTRAESLYEIIKHYRLKDSKYAKIAGMYYDLAKQLSYPYHDALFIRRDVYEHLIDYEYSILAYYLKTPVDYYRYLELLGKTDNYSNVISNYKFYVKQMDSVPCLMRKEFNTKATFSIPAHASASASEDTFQPSTPSIIPHGNGYLMNQRYVNYYIQPNGSYVYNPPITTVNRRLKLDTDLNVIEQLDLDQLPTEYDRYAGVEDVKIFQHGDQIVYTGTVEDVKTKKLRVGVGLYPMDSETKMLTPTICASPENNECEKNWCYVADDGVLKIIYKWSPITIGCLVGDRLKIDTRNYETPAFFKHLRGSTNGIPYGNEIWFMTHMVEYSTPRVYYHCIIILDRATLKYKRHSILFKFEKTQIEYCLGLVVEDKRLIFGYSKMDRETILSVYERPQIDHFLFP
jgi:glycosyltransferase involved in cell wall biosynthesis